ncbi:MAG: glycosyltransferase [Acetobacteraceae bacterium]|nr:glycosyltransferase [Acetobacteraceae bacterium]
MARALEVQQVPFATIRTRAALRGEQGVGPRTVPPDAAPFAMNIVCANGDGTRGFMRQAGPRFFDDRYSIALWWWEVGRAPARWAEVSRTFNEVWVCSDHVLEALSGICMAPLLKIRQPVPLPSAPPLSRRELGLPDGFIFYSTFDYSSTFARKNPLAVAAAFRRAFAEGSGAHLVIRSVNGRRDRHHRRRLERAVDGRSDIHIIDRDLESRWRNAMLAQCDCYVSLHRAEGFGLSLAEAMRLGKPVIATAWSGNLEFMTPENSYLVRCDTVAVGPGSWPYDPKAVWAEPDIEHAAAAMREILEDPARAAATGAQAARDLRAWHDPSVAGGPIAQRLDDLRAKQSSCLI